MKRLPVDIWSGWAGTLDLGTGDRRGRIRKRRVGGRNPPSLPDGEAGRGRGGRLGRDRPGFQPRSTTQAPLAPAHWRHHRRRRVKCDSTSSSLARVRKEEAKRASLLDNSSLEENEGSLLEEREGSLLEEREASLLCCNAASRLFRSLHRYIRPLPVWPASYRCHPQFF